ncbi:YlxR family protein [Actinomyces mediterranea]|uniref:YlxR family protein n=1 Tax=Actinomyces mediterranea TaxID=1871028 RepID=UPI000970DD41|nr:YlxR family protein [Actinomyces mediterranea]
MPHSAQDPGTASRDAGPVRTCVGCAKRAPRSDLIRIAAPRGGSATADPHCNQPGRGAWIHPDPRCVERARQRRTIERSLRVSEMPSDDMWDELGLIVQSRASTAPHIE